MTAAQESAADIDRQFAAETGLTCAHQVMAFAFFTQADFSILQQFRGRGGVVELDQMEAVGSDTRRFIGGVRRRRDRALSLARTGCDMRSYHLHRFAG